MAAAVKLNKGVASGVGFLRTSESRDQTVRRLSRQPMQTDHAHAAFDVTSKGES
jgi:hypothetical protein